MILTIKEHSNHKWKNVLKHFNINFNIQILKKLTFL
jgi:hypothetical protein